MKCCTNCGHALTPTGDGSGFCPDCGEVVAPREEATKAKPVAVAPSPPPTILELLRPVVAVVQEIVEAADRGDCEACRVAAEQVREALERVTGKALFFSGPPPNDGSVVSRERAAHEAALAHALKALPALPERQAALEKVQEVFQLGVVEGGYHLAALAPLLDQAVEAGQVAA
jgi:hypothetical protein